MSSIEERLQQDIAAVTKGVVVTETDLWDARTAIDERIDTKTRQSRRAVVAMVAAAAVVVAGVGLGAFQAIGGEEQAITPAGSGDIYADYLTGDAPTPELMNGFWRVDNGSTMVRFQADGTVQFSDQGSVINDPVTTGTYAIDGETIAVTVSDAPRCASSDFTMRVALPERGLVNAVLSEPQFGTCKTVATTIALEQVVPAGKMIAGFDNSNQKGWRPVTGSEVLYGDWVAEGGGYLLELDGDGAYYVVDESAEVIDYGEWSFGGSGLSLTSSAGSALCRRGDQFILAGVEQATPGTTLIRGNVETNACGGGWTPDRWIRIPDATTSDTSG